MATYLGEVALATDCRRMFEHGRAWIDANLFNGEYYEHEIRPQHLGTPEHQVGRGCLVDQLVGQAASRMCGLGPLLDQDHVEATLQSIMRHNFRSPMRGHFNHFRSYALADESGLVIASYPRGDRPDRPFPYAYEVWSRLEYTAAVGMLQEGQTDAAVRVIEAVRARHDGARRNPFDEVEYGHHFAGALAAWGAVVAIAGFSYSAVRAEMRFAAAAGTVFWSNGSAWGTCSRNIRDDRWDVRLDVLGGDVQLRAFELTGAARAELGSERRIHAGEHLALQLLA